jgi:hypothetical protein
MAKFKRIGERKMPPINGRKFSTTYTKQSPKAREELKDFVVVIWNHFDLSAQNDPSASKYATDPLKGFPRTQGKPNYSPRDIIEDLLTQLAEGKDIPSGMEGRWNRLFADVPEYQIEWEDEPTWSRKKPLPVTTTTFNSLFGDSND